MPATGAPRILIAGGGYVGLYAALQLEDELRPGEADIILINPENYMTYQPLLPEVASGTLEPRHAVVPLRTALQRTQLITGRLEGLDPQQRRARIAPTSGEPYELEYEHVVIGIGAKTRVLPVPGLEEHSVGFQTVTEAIHLRNHVLDRLEAAEATTDGEARRRALTFVFVGGGYTGVEALAELEDMAQSACRYFPTISPHEMRWVLVEATDRILPTVSTELADYALRLLRSRGIEVLLETTLEAVDEGVLTLSDGRSIAADTLVWVAGVAPNALVTELGLPVDDKGLVQVEQTLQVRGVDGAWAAGDNAAVPDGGGGFHPPTAQHAQREGTQIGRNIAAHLRGREAEPFVYTSPGEMITLGHRKGVATMFGRQLRGMPIWALRRLYYVGQVPTLKRKLRILLDWLVDLPFPRDIVGLGSVERPDEPLRRAAEQSDAA
jgi:NADH:ubiquinone reductase (H+-translocating)